MPKKKFLIYLKIPTNWKLKSIKILE